MTCLAQAVKPAFPGQAEEAVRLPLGGLGIVQFQEAVVLLDKAGPLLGQLLGQPVVPIHVNLNREREPGLDPHVHSSKLRVQKVVVQDTLRATRERQARLALAVAEFHRAAALQAAQHRDQATGQLPLADRLVDQLLFGVLALEIPVRSAFLSGCRLGVFDQPLGKRLQLREKILAADAQPIDELIELFVAPQRQIPLEDHAVHAVQRCYNGIRELRRKPCGDTHGVLLPEGL